MTDTTTADAFRAYMSSRNGKVTTGAEVLNQIAEFLARFIAYPTEHSLTAHTLWIAHTHLIDHWDSTPRIAFLSPEPGSGKSRALEVTEPLVPRPVHAVNCSPAYLFRKVSDPDGSPTILYDEIDTVFGPKAKDNEDVRGMLNAGHRKGAVAGRCTVKGKTIETEELPAYCAVALAGLDDLPDTLMTRSIVVRMRKRAPGEVVEPWRLRVNGPRAEALRQQLATWTESIRDNLTVMPTMPAGVEDRKADVWEALIAVAAQAGGDWPGKANVAAVADVADLQGDTPSMGVMLLRDLRTIFVNSAVVAGEDPANENLGTQKVLAALNEMEDSPWGDLHGRPLDARGLSRRLAKFGVKSKSVRVRDQQGIPRGYSAADLADPWSRYLPQDPAGQSPQKSATSATSATSSVEATTVAATTPTVAATSATVAATLPPQSNVRFPS